jgi:hypothetical protein
MKKANLLLFMAIFMFVITTLFLFSGMALVPVNKIFIIVLSLTTIVGYLGALCYYDMHLKEKGGKGL